MKVESFIKPIAAPSFAIDLVDCKESESAIGADRALKTTRLQIAFPVPGKYLTITPNGATSGFPLDFYFLRDLRAASLVTGVNESLIMQVDVVNGVAKKGRVGIGPVPLELATFRPLFYDLGADYLSASRSDFRAKQDCSGRLFLPYEDENALVSAFSAKSLNDAVGEGQLVARQAAGALAVQYNLTLPKIGLSRRSQTLKCTTAENHVPIATINKPLQTAWGLLANYQVAQYILGNPVLDAPTMYRAVDLFRSDFERGGRERRLQERLTQKQNASPVHTHYISAA